VNDGPRAGRTQRRPPKSVAGYVSTGHLPSPGQVQGAVDEAYRMYRSEASGETSQTYPALARVPGDLFGICVAGIGGGTFGAGDTGYEFTIMSVAKPFVFALVCELLGAEQVRQKLGVNATGLAFDSLVFVERSADGRSNPMVNAGAIAAGLAGSVQEAIAMAIGSRPTFMGLSAELVATRIGMTWPRQEGGFLTSM